MLMSSSFHVFYQLRNGEDPDHDQDSGNTKGLK